MYVLGIYFYWMYYYINFFLQIRNSETQNCLDTMGHKSGENLGMAYCHELGGNQVFAYTKRQQIMSDDNCLDSAHPRGPVRLVRCHGMAGNQAWMYDNHVSAIVQLKIIVEWSMMITFYKMVIVNVWMSQ